MRGEKVFWGTGATLPIWGGVPSVAKSCEIVVKFLNDWDGTILLRAHADEEILRARFLPDTKLLYFLEDVSHTAVLRKQKSPVTTE